MPQAEFLLQERYSKRYIKDRLARFTVISGGISILAAILLIFFYLVFMVLPIFSAAEVKPLASYPFTHKDKIVGVGIGDYGENAFLFDGSGHLSYVGFEEGGARTLLTTRVMEDPQIFAQSDQAQGWYAYVGHSGEIVAVQPRFSVSYSGDGKVLTPNMAVFPNGGPLVVDTNKQEIEQLSFAIRDNRGTFVLLTEQNQAIALRVDSAPDPGYAGGVNRVTPLALPNFQKSIDQILISPDARQLFALVGNELIISEIEGERFKVREIVDLSRNQPNKGVVSISLLSGARSVLVSHQDHTLSQWFDVLKGGERTLTRIRQFKLGEGSDFLITDVYRKGFYSFKRDGSLQGIYTTSEKVLFHEPLLDRSPDIAAISSNEGYLLTLDGESISTHRIINPHPEISFSSLWREVWYENYPEPDYVWQSTSASDDYEPKFSLVPIVFGTLKATFFAMLFSVPVAVLGAIYTAYFMSTPMRRVVKPSIELMEALPTVIIGFLAGMWFAPIVERYLMGVMTMIMVIPLSIIAVSLAWMLMPKRALNKLPNGWHGVVLIPIIIAVGIVCMSYSVDMEQWLFGGDIRFFLEEYGIGYDQRNALIVGSAMGFAVIPTIFTIAEDAIFSVPKHLSDGSLALGATQWQTLIYVVLLTASPGIFSAIMIGLGRAIGETMIVLMATGNTPVMDFNIFEGMRSLSATIAVEMPESEVGNTHYRVLFLAALVLFIFTFAVNSLAGLVRQRLKDRYSTM